MKSVTLLSTFFLACALLAGCGQSSGGGPFDDAFAELMPPSPSEVARDLFNPYDADQRRRAINMFAAAPFGGEEAYLRAYRIHIDPSSADPDPTVRAAALRALGTHGSPTDIRYITPWLDAKHERVVRVEAATALQRIQHPSAVEPLVTALRDDEDSQVRVASAGALAQYPNDKVFQTLVGALHDEDYAVVTQSVQSLELITGEKFGEDGRTWLEWAEKTGNRYANAGQYFYPHYEKPPGMMEKMQFWKEETPTVPRRPTTASGPAGDGEPGS